MLEWTATRWLNFLYALPILKGVTEFGKVPVDATGYAGCALITVGLVLIAGNEFSVVMEDARRNASYSSKPTVEDRIREAREPKPEPIPSPFEGLNLVTRVNGIAKPAANYNYVTQAVRLNKERRVAMILLRNNDRGEAFDLTEETWARNKEAANGQKIQKFMSRSELKALKTKWEIGGLICRLSAASNAPYDANDWNKIKSVAQGRPLPQ